MRPFAELSAKKKTVEVVRWLCVVPAAWLAAMMPRFIYWLLVPPAMAQPPGTPRPPVSDFQRLYLPQFFGVVMAAAFVIVGAKLAPRWRVTVALFLSVAWLVYSFMTHVLPHASYELRYFSHFIVATATVLATSAYIWYSERSQKGSGKLSADA
jgi:hypothetical protein